MGNHEVSFCFMASAEKYSSGNSRTLLSFLSKFGSLLVALLKPLKSVWLFLVFLKLEISVIFKRSLQELLPFCAVLWLWLPGSFSFFLCILLKSWAFSVSLEVSPGKGCFEGHTKHCCFPRNEMWWLAAWPHVLPLQFYKLFLWTLHLFIGIVYIHQSLHL